LKALPLCFTITAEQLFSNVAVILSGANISLETLKMVLG
jgi:hypothetical protein